MNYLDKLIEQNLQALAWPLEPMVQLLLAALCGGLVGLERELRGRQAGFRTNILVAVGSALVMIVSTQMAFRPWPLRAGGGESVQISVDPARIAYGVMTGVGFLGAGTIVQHRGNVRGLTTAASLWCVAAVGLTAGLGLYLLLMFATLLILASLWVLDHFESVLPRLHYREVVLRRRWQPGAVRETIELLKAAGLKVVDASYERANDLRDIDIHLHIAFTSKKAFYEFERHLEHDQAHEVLAVRE